MLVAVEKKKSRTLKRHILGDILQLIDQFIRAWNVTQSLASRASPGQYKKER